MNPVWIAMDLAPRGCIGVATHSDRLQQSVALAAGLPGATAAPPLSLPRLRRHCPCHGSAGGRRRKRPRGRAAAVSPPPPPSHEGVRSRRHRPVGSSLPGNATAPRAVGTPATPRGADTARCRAVPPPPSVLATAAAQWAPRAATTRRAPLAAGMGGGGVAAATAAEPAPARRARVWSWPPAGRRGRAAPPLAVAAHA